MENEIKWQFREVDSTDLFPLTTIIARIGVKDIKEALRGYKIPKEDEDRFASRVGLVTSIVGLVLEKLESIQDLIYKYLARLCTNLTEEEIRKQSPADFIEMLYALLNKEEFTDFFKVALRLLGLAK